MQAGAFQSVDFSFRALKVSTINSKKKKKKKKFNQNRTNKKSKQFSIPRRIRICCRLRVDRLRYTNRATRQALVDCVPVRRPSTDEQKQTKTKPTNRTSTLSATSFSGRDDTCSHSRDITCILRHRFEFYRVRDLPNYWIFACRLLT
jgi:UDP-N-acetylglucosamine pyrophosphorylase